MPPAYKTATAFRQALEQRLKRIASERGIPLNTLRLKVVIERLLARPFFTALTRGCSWAGTRWSCGTPKYAKWCHALRKNRERDWISAGVPFPVVVEWMSHSDEVARQHYLRVNESDMRGASQTRIAPDRTQEVTQIEESGPVAADDEEPQVFKLADFMKKAGEGIRTLDVQLGKDDRPSLRLARDATTKGCDLQGMLVFAAS